MSLKQKIISESIKLFSTQGYMNTSIMDIMLAANVSKGGFYNHFNSKEALFKEVVNVAQKMWREEVLHGIDELEYPLEKIFLAIQNYNMRYLRNNTSIPGGCIFITLSVELDDQSPHLYTYIKKGFDGFRRMLNGWFKEAASIGQLKSSLDIDAVTEMVFATMIGASVIYGGEQSSEKSDLTFGSLLQYIENLRI